MPAAPDRHFLLIGSAKCGSTSLSSYLSQHPDVLLSEPKEPIFFEAEFERGLDYYHARYFPHWQGETVVGDARTHHLMLPFVAERIHALLPDVRLIAILRDPVERAYSHWWHRTSQGLESLGLREALEENRVRLESGMRFDRANGDDGVKAWYEGLVQPPSNTTRHRLYLELGHYAEQLVRYVERFSREQLRVVFMEELGERPLPVTRDLWRFLGVDPEQQLDAPTALNAAQTRVRSPRQFRMRHLAARVRKGPGGAWLQRALPGPLKRRFVSAMQGRVAERPELDAETERWLVAYYEPHNRALEALLGRPLPGWRREPGSGTPSG